MSSDEDYAYEYSHTAEPEEDDEDEVEEEEEEIDVVAKKPKKERRRRRKKDPNKPRGALTPYMCFSKQIRPVIQNENPGAGVTDIAKIIGAKWRALTDEEKEPFKVLAQKDRARYNAQMKDYVPTPGYDDSGRARRRKQKDPNAPKKPKSAYFLFAESRRAALREENPAAKISVIAKLTGEEWRGLTDEDKKPFFEEAGKLKAVYDQQMAAYKASL
jgi:hypothetical protein